MTEDNSFFNITSAGDLNFVKHNPTDYDKFKDFQKEMDEKFSKAESEKQKKEILANIKRWEESLPSRWSDASIPKINNDGSKKATEIMNQHGFKSIFIQGAPGSGKTYLGYAVIRRFIGMGWVTPSHVKIVSEEFLLGLAAAGFEGSSRFQELLKPKYTVYLFDGVYSRNKYTERELQLWEQLIDHIYTKSLTAVFTSNKTAKEFSTHLSDSTESKMGHLIEGRVITLTSTNRSGKLSDEPTVEDTERIKKDRGIDLFND